MVSRIFLETKKKRIIPKLSVLLNNFGKFSVTILLTISNYIPFSRTQIDHQVTISRIYKNNKKVVTFNFCIDDHNLESFRTRNLILFESGTSVRRRPSPFVVFDFVQNKINAPNLFERRRCWLISFEIMKFSSENA